MSMYLSWTYRIREIIYIDDYLVIKWIVLYSVSIYAGKVDMDLHDILVWIAYVHNACD